MTVAPSFDAMPVMNEPREAMTNGKSDPGIKKCTSC